MVFLASHFKLQILSGIVCQTITSIVYAVVCGKQEKSMATENYTIIDNVSHFAFYEMQLLRSSFHSRLAICKS